jgi:hypothetical protein
MGDVSDTAKPPKPPVPELKEDPLGEAFPGGRHDPWRRTLRLGMFGAALALVLVLGIIFLTPTKPAIVTTSGDRVTSGLRSALIHQLHLGLPATTRQVDFVREKGFDGGAVAMRFSTDRTGLDQLLGRIGRTEADLQPGTPPYAVFRFHHRDQAWSMDRLSGAREVAGAVDRPRHRRPWSSVTLVVTGPTQRPTVHLFATTQH